MSFELKKRDLLGRIGRLKTKSGVVETPVLMPVINPLSQTIPPKSMMEEFGCDIVITNAYIIKRHFEDSSGIDVHRLIEFDGVVATDSGGYQILVYGGVDASPEEMIEFQKSLNSDIAVILDIPTGWNVPRSRVEWTVEETLRRAKEAIPHIEGGGTLWVGPVQGGSHLDLVERSARAIGSMPYHVHALGSPTEVMESYRFPLLVDMIMSAKLNLPPNRPFHLFGAGHPMMFSLIVALGCDMFDSAAYALYAKRDRYLTPLGTKRLEDIDYLPCSCPVCRSLDAEELKDMMKGERLEALSKHNLHVSMAELDIIKQAVSEGTLWELLESRSRGHPSLSSAFRKIGKYWEELEKGTPSKRVHGLFFFDSWGLARPEITRHIKRLEADYLPPKGSTKLVLISAPNSRPYSKNKEYGLLLDRLEAGLGETLDQLHICFYAAPFGVVPAELSETYPLSQFEKAQPLDRETLERTAMNVASYVGNKLYNEIILVSGMSGLDLLVEKECLEVCRKKRKLVKVVSEPNPWSVEVIEKLESVLKG